MKLKIDSSALSAWKRCPEYFYRRYVKGLIPIAVKEKLTAADIGTCIHKAFELMYSGESSEMAYNALETTARSIVPEGDNEALQAQIKSIQGLFNNYLVQWGNPDITFVSTKQVEKSLSSPLSADVEYCGSIDLIARLNDSDELVAVDHKTSSSLSYIQQKCESDQFTGYIWLCQMAGLDINQVIVNGLCTSQKAIGNPEMQFTRYLTRRNEEAIQEWRQRTLRDCSRILEDINSKTFSKFLDSCHDFAHNCEYQEICFCNKELTEEAEKNGFRVDFWKNCSVE